MGKKTVEDNTTFKMETFIKALFIKIAAMEKELLDGKTEANIQVIGIKIVCKAMENIEINTVLLSKECLLMVL